MVQKTAPRWLLPLHGPWSHCTLRVPVRPAARKDGHPDRGLPEGRWFGVTSGLGILNVGAAEDRAGSGATLATGRCSPWVCLGARVSVLGHLTHSVIVS